MLVSPWSMVHGSSLNVIPVRFHMAARVQGCMYGNGMQSSGSEAADSGPGKCILEDAGCREGAVGRREGEIR